MSSPPCPDDFALPKPIHVQDHPMVDVHTLPNTAGPLEENFSTVDSHAASISKLEFKSFRELMWDLIYCQDFDESSRARVIFRWITINPMDKITFSQTTPNSPEDLFMSFIADSTVAFALIYQLLASYAGLSCALIVGHAKGEDYLPGDTIFGRPFNHSWNAVFVNKQWNLVDCNWSTRFIKQSGSLPITNELIHQYEKYFYFMDPYQAVYSHFPQELKWQLLPDDKCLTVELFQLLPSIKPHFFESGLILLDAPMGVMYTNDGRLKVSLRHQTLAEFTFSLELREGPNLTNTFNGQSLQSYCVMETEVDRVTAYFRLPKKGEYFFTIYNMIINTIDDICANRFNSLCVYKIFCRDAPSQVEPFIGFLDTSFGACWPLVIYFGLHPLTYRGGIINVPDDTDVKKTNLTFRLEQSNVTMVAKLRRSVMTEVGARCITPYDDTLVKKSRSNDLVSFTLTLPDKGMYVFEVFANKGKDVDSCTLVYQYLIQVGNYQEFPVQKPIDSALLSKLPDPYTTTTPKMPPILARVISKYSQWDEVKPEMEDEMHLPVFLAPEDFRLHMISPMDPSAEIPQDQLPTSDFASLLRKTSSDDGETLKVSRRSQNDFRELMWQLIFSRGLDTDEDKIRAIFIWLVSKDLKDLDFPNAIKGSPEALLMRIKQGNGTYAEAFTILCRHAKIKCRTIYGYAKGVAFVPGMKMSRNAPVLHSWNIARINDKWHLFDCQWAARRITEKFQSIDEFLYFVDNFFFMVNPDHLKWTHFPHDPKWQLLTEPISIQFFEWLAPVKSAYFKFELDLYSHPNGYIDVANPELEIIVRMSEENYKRLDFSRTLIRMNGNEPEPADLSLHSIHYKCVTNPPECVFMFRFPSPGVYCILLYVRDMGSDTYDGFVEYRVLAEFPYDMAKKPFPQEVVETCGPTFSFYRLDVKFGNDVGRRAVLYNTKAEMFDFKVLYQTVPHFSGKYLCDWLTPEALAQSLLKRMVYGDPQDQPYLVCIFSLIFREAGEFVFQMYAGKDDYDRALVFSWLICNSYENLNFGVLPVFPEGVLGALPSFIKMGCLPKYAFDPLIPIHIVYGKDEYAQSWPIADCEVSFLCPKGYTAVGDSNIRIVGELTRSISEQMEEKSSQYLLQQANENLLTFLMRFPRPGLYKLSIYAHKLPDPKEFIPITCTYLLIAKPRVDPVIMPYIGAWRGPFPRQTQKWKESGVLIEPFDGRIDMRDKDHLSIVHFSLILARAKEVVVSYDNYQCHLNANQLFNSDYCQWEGDVIIPKEKNKRICVAGRWTDQTYNYPLLLEYKVKI